MRHLGNVRTLEEALTQGEAIAKAEGKTFVYEKALGKNHPNPKKFVIYRGWLDLDDNRIRVIDIKQWDKERKDKEPLALIEGEEYIKIATDTKYIWICLNIDCSCLFTNEIRDNNPSLEDCINCDHLRFIEKDINLIEESKLKTREKVRIDLVEGENKTWLSKNPDFDTKEKYRQYVADTVKRWNT